MQAQTIKPQKQQNDILHTISNMQKCTYSYIMSVTEFTITNCTQKNKYSTQNVIDKTNIKNNTIHFQTLVYLLRCLTIKTLNLKT